MQTKVNQIEIWIKHKVEDKNNKNINDRTGFTKTYNIQDQTSYDTNTTPFKKVLQSLYWHICGTHFLTPFLKLLRDSKDFILPGTWLHIFGSLNDGILKVELFLMLWWFWIWNWKISFKISWHNPLATL